MSSRLEWLYKLGLTLCVIGIFWSVWASAQSSTANGPATNSTTLAKGGTNEMGLLEQKLGKLEEKLGEHDLIFHLDRFEFLRTTQIFGQPLWKYVASLVYIFFAFYISKLFDFLIGVWLKRWASRTTSNLDDLLLEALRGPVKMVTFVIFLHVGLTVFRWPDRVQGFLSKALIVIVAFSITYVSLKVVDLLMGVWRERNVVGTDKSFDEQLFPIVRKSVKMFVVIIAVLVTAQNLRIDITGAIASLSIGGLALGLAAQDTLANLFGAIAVYMDKPFRIGDRIQLADVDGTVESIGMRSTRVRSLDGYLITVPNKTMGNATIVNVTERPTIKTVMNIGLTYDTSAEKIRRALAIIQEVYGKSPKTKELTINFNRFGDSALNINVVHLWNSTDNKEYLEGMQDMNLKLKECFDAEGIEFAFPTQTLHVKQGAVPGLMPQPKTT